MNKLVKSVILVLIILGWSKGFAQQKMTADLLWKLARVSGPTISPDGQLAVIGIKKYNISENKGNRDLYKVPVKGGTPKQLTTDNASEFNELWRPDGKKIGFLSSSSGSVQLWEINPDSSNLMQITNIKDGINGFEYSPLGDKILFIKDVKLDTAITEKYPDLPLANAKEFDDLMYRHWNTWSDYSYSHVFYANYSEGKIITEGKDVMQGEKFDTPMNPFGGMEQITWSKDSKFIIYTSKKKTGVEWAKSTNSELYKYDISTGKTTNLTEGMMGYDVNPQFNKTGNILAWLSMKHDGFESDKNDIVIMDIATGTKTNLTENIDITVSEFLWSEKGDKIYFLAVINATNQLFEITVANKKVHQITSGQHNYTSLSANSNYLFGTRQDMIRANELFKIDIKKGTESALTDINKAIYSELEVPTIQKRMIPTTDGKQMLTWVIYPPGFDSTKKYPTILYCQGGPQSAVSQFFSFRWNFNLMASHGYIIVAPNRRGLPGFGQEWNDEISKDWGGQAMKDYLSAIDALAKEPYCDNDKLGCIGASYGGYSTYYLAGIHQKRFKCFIAHAGIFNLESWYASTEELFFANWDVGGPFWQKNPPKSYEEFSPHKFVQNWDTPIMIIHGQQDFRIPVAQGIQAFESARMLGIPSRFLYFPDECHWILQPQNGLLWHREFFEWLDKWLK